MPFSHHSHSGQFCSHATDTLEAMICRAVALQMSVFCLTEHMPRESCDLYPGEVEETSQAMGQAQLTEQQTSAFLEQLFADYYHEARRLQSKYASQIRLLVGLEVDWIRPSSHTWIENLQQKYKLETLVGSVHHVHEIPIDFSRALYEEARRKSGGTEGTLFAAYFDLQYDMLRALRPPLVGHFDLVRLKSDDPNGCIRDLDATFPAAEIWLKVRRNLELVKSYAGIIEINSAALRKGLREPYPQAAICQEIKSLGIGVALSDDAHGIDQIGAKYSETLTFIQRRGLTELTVFGSGQKLNNPCFPDLEAYQIEVSKLQVS